MKTAISLPDQVFEAAEDLARDLGVSRSQLYARAVSEFLVRHHGDEITRRLDRVYAGVDARLDPVLEEMQARSIARDEA